MSDPTNTTQQQKDNLKPPTKPSIESGPPYSGQKAHYPNPPEVSNPDPATLRDQWRFAIRQYSKWYSHAWGTAILAGGAFFALGWIIKGANPLPSKDSKAQASSTQTHGDA